MIEAVLPQASLLKKIIEAIKELVDEANFDFSETGIRLQAMDKSHIALSFLHLRNDGFSEYRCDRSQTLGINLNSFSKILKCAANDDQVQVKATDKAETLAISFESASKDRVSEFNLKLMDIDIDSVDVPDMDYQATVSMSSQEFARIVRDLMSLGDAVTIDATKQGVRFSANGDDGSGSILLRHKKLIDDEGSAASTTVDIIEPVNHSLALKYLANFAKAAPLADRVTINLIEDAPVMFEFKISDMGQIRFYLAPQIEDDNE
ncbi:hypothetical protein LPJ78_002790 [Coemansia sp. RSA 989]|nr:proliferating cell nuclear antigen, N-terminal domain-containing protein [Coemansia mojavensis]KAJ1742698.1 hypothetical protein LPJ68_001669 [Coemansia sp. RSA 1086]KAJ1752473.1 hypothetical protein LPJ79_001220 [Coemansia sp. RSA 1821]KAJ1865302.1 hypothetical protein LPJ78_002790 [Coemansia sp. RSA 989]KAJ1874538.1 hypothetical protein LPJ55_001398 [Coemansia sp. RSA 990]KAJ2648617.1 hypothetical protein IWW40_003803 [Coemansia sp. RSA 1250]KAJ2673317.1 hypothetical protein IWW42_002327